MFRVINWNLNWAKKGSSRGQRIKQIIRSYDADLICLTETYDNFLDDLGYSVSSHPNYGYKIIEGRRKVVMWSKTPWYNNDNLGVPQFPTGRYVHAQTSTPLGIVMCIGVCIPWREAHVYTGQKNRKIWEDHIQYLVGLEEMRQVHRQGKRIIFGDFNQRIPRHRQPIRVFEKLQEITRSYNVSTEGVIMPENRQTIDHLLHTTDLITKSIESIPNQSNSGKKLSDHFGILITLGLSAT